MRTVRHTLAIGVVSTVLAGGCATGSGRLPMAEELVTVGAADRQGDLAALRRGRALTVTECLACHRMYWPHEYAPQAWPTLARKMGRLASLNSRQIQDLERYLVAAARAGRHLEAPSTITDR